MFPLFTLDFEASCLPQHGPSFPIEVGVAGPGLVRAWLIRPEPAWRDWTWTEEAEGLHGLTFDQLLREGRPASDVLDELSAVLDGAEVFADSYFDAGWMRTLESAAGAPPRIRVQHIDALIDRLQLSDPEVSAAVAALEAQAFRRHRAGEDARWLRALAVRLQEAAAPRPVKAQQAA